jgi:tetratricopeptide (TPR) repeat protein
MACQYSFSQADTAQLKNLYDRCLDFNEDKIDSIRIYADYISKEAARLQYNKGDVLSLRLKGIYEDLSNNYEKAIEYYLKSLEAARKVNSSEYEMAALSDLAIAYFAIKEPEKAKEFYLQCAGMSERNGKIPSLINTYNNLAVIYTQLKQYDSSRLLLYRAVRLGKPLEEKGRVSLASTYNNLGNLYFKEKKYDDALPYFRRNLLTHTLDSNWNGLWVAMLNMADVYIEKHQFDSATYYAQSAMQMAQRLNSKSK